MNKGNPYILRWTLFRMHAHPQAARHVTMLFAYTAADALTQARLKNSEGGDSCGSGEVTYNGLRPPIDDAECSLVARALHIWKQTPSGYDVHTEVVSTGP